MKAVNKSQSPRSASQVAKETPIENMLSGTSWLKDLNFRNGNQPEYSFKI